MRNSRWTPELAGDQSGRVAIVTGANTGLGYETALALADKGAYVILACRNQERAEAARARIRASFPAANVTISLLDTGSLASVRAFAERFASEYDRLDLLINNAGIMVTPYARTEDGFESQFAVNYLGHFLLTGLLLEKLAGTHGSRVVSLYSLAADWGGIQFDDPQFERRYDKTKAYAQSKLACLMFGIELQQRLRAAGCETLSLAAHPGFSQSDLSRHLPGGLQLVLSLAAPLFMQSTTAGAMPSLYAALAEGVRGGEAIGPAGRGQRRGPPTVVEPVAAARDAAQRQRLWTLSEELVGHRYAFPACVGVDATDERLPV